MFHAFPIGTLEERDCVQNYCPVFHCNKICFTLVIIPNEFATSLQIVEALMPKAQAMNPLVKIVADTDDPSSKDLKFFEQFTIIAATGIKSSLLLKIDKNCRAHNVQLIYGDVFGMFGYSLADFQEHEFYE